MERTINMTELQKTMFSAIFKCPIYPSSDWIKVINKLKKKSKDDVVDIIDKVLRKSYKGRIPYPEQCCDFATDFGFMVFKDLGYNVSILQNFNVGGEHNFLLVDGEGIDFTSEQIDKSLPIRNVDLKNKYYIGSKIHVKRVEALTLFKYEWFAEEAKKQTITGLMNYVPFSYIIEKMTLKNKR